MDRFVPKEKLSKKARKKLEAEKREIWACSPVTRKVESRKVYNRKRIPRGRDWDGTGGFLLPGFPAAKKPDGARPAAARIR